MNETNNEKGASTRFAARTSSHALLSVLIANGVERAFLVPGESYLGVLDALNDFPQLDVVTCRHEAGAGFMACADARLSGKPALAMVSRGPGASNASIAVHTAEQDALPVILLIGQVPKDTLRWEAFQEIDYQRMFGGIAKWVFEPTTPEQLADAAFKAVRIATTGTPGPVVLVIPEDIQQQDVNVPARGSEYVAAPHRPTLPAAEALAEVRGLIERAQRPLIIAGGQFEKPGGREALRAFAEAWQIPVAVSFRRHDCFPNNHPLYAGDLGLSNATHQMQAFHDSDLILALGTRLGDITTQGYSFPKLPQPAQTLVHVHPDDHTVGLHFAANPGVVCDPVALTQVLLPAAPRAADAARAQWLERLRSIREGIARWPALTPPAEGVHFTEVVRAVAERAPDNAIVCLDAGTFAAPVYRHFPFVYPQRLMSPLAGAMGYGTPAAIAAALRCPAAKVICMVGDGGFLMTGNEMIAAVERKLPVLFIVSDNGCYGSIRIHQEVHYPGRHAGTSLFNPDFARIAEAFGVEALRVRSHDEIAGAIAHGMGAAHPVLLHVATNLGTVLPRRAA